MSHATPKTINNRRATATLTLAKMPATAHVGLTFNPDTTDAVATVTKLGKGERGEKTVNYRYDHAPEVIHERPYAEVQRMAWAVV